MPIKIFRGGHFWERGREEGGSAYRFGKKSESLLDVYLRFYHIHKISPCKVVEFENFRFSYCTFHQLLSCGKVPRFFFGKLELKLVIWFRYLFISLLYFSDIKYVNMCGKHLNWLDSIWNNQECSGNFRPFPGKVAASFGGGDNTVVYLLRALCEVSNILLFYFIFRWVPVPICIVYSILNYLYLGSYV